ncbi:MAG: esterase/lipase [Bacteroidetes bacterium]|nr:esterase/lipase [Bacteroidota bacterium]
MKRLYTTLLLLFVAIVLFAADISKSTYIYSVKEKDTLRLDKYELKTGDTKKPCVLFVFGGGFVGGKRDKAIYLDYFKQLAQSGYIVASIDYHLGLKSTLEDFKNGKKVGAKEIVKRLKNAIDLAVEDLYDATNFILQHADEWNVDTNTIVASGSSAGAITVLQAEYYLHSNDSKLPKMLPQKFDYAGVISFAGAIFSTSGNLKWTSPPAPIQLFHGDADKNVPYNKAKILSVGFFGSKYLTEQLDKTKSPYQFIDFNNVDHIVAESPMKENLADIQNFLSEWVLKKRKAAEHILVKDFTLPEAKKDFGIGDYIRANFSN